MCVGVGCTCQWRYLQRSEEKVRKPWIGVTGYGELCDLGARTWIWVLCKSSIYLQLLWHHSSLLCIPHFISIMSLSSSNVSYKVIPLKHMTYQPYKQSWTLVLDSFCCQTLNINLESSYPYSKDSFIWLVNSVSR